MKVWLKEEATMMRNFAMTKYCCYSTSVPSVILDLEVQAPARRKRSANAYILLKLKKTINLLGALHGLLRVEI